MKKTTNLPERQGTMVFVVADAAAVNIDCVSAFSFGPCIAVIPPQRCGSRS